MGEQSRGGPGEFVAGSPVAGYRLDGRRSPRRWPWILLIIVIVLVILAVAADFIAKAFAQDPPLLAAKPRGSARTQPLCTRFDGGAVGEWVLPRQQHIGYAGKCK